MVFGSNQTDRMCCDVDAVGVGESREVVDGRDDQLVQSELDLVLDAGSVLLERLVFL